MANKRYTIQPVGNVAVRLQSAIDDLREAGLAVSEAAALTMIVARGLDALDQDADAKGSRK